MEDEVDRLSSAIDDLVAEHDPSARKELSVQEAELAATAAMLRAAVENRLEPTEEFVDSLARRLASGEENAPVRGQSRGQTGISRRSALRRVAAAVAGLAAGGVGIGALYEKGKSDGGHEEVASALTAPMVPQDRGTWQTVGYTISRFLPDPPCGSERALWKDL